MVRAPIGWPAAAALTLVAVVLGGVGGCGDGAADPAGGGGAPVGEASEGAPVVGPSGDVDPEDYRAVLEAAEAWIEAAEPDRAEAILRVALRRRPGEGRASEMLGQVLIGRAADAAEAGRTSAAAAFRSDAWAVYRSAAEAAPDDARLQTSAGLVGMTAGDDDGALACFERAEAADARLPQPPLYAGQIHLKAGRLDAAEAAFDRVLALDPDEPYAHASLAVVRVEQARCDEAVAFAAEARRLRPDDPTMRVQEARVLRRCGRVEEAIARLSAFPAEQRAINGMTEELAACEALLDQHDRAAAEWQQAWTHRRPGAARGRAAAAAADAWRAFGDLESAWAWCRRAGADLPAAELEALEARLRAAGASGADG